MTRSLPIVLAWANVALHALGLAFAAFAMRPGTAAVSLSERTAYLAGRPLGWTLGWSVWIACLVVMVAFAVAVASRPCPRPGLARLAAVVDLVGGAFDLLGDSLYIVVFPLVAPDERLFVVVEKATAVVSLVVANGLYSLGTLLMGFAVFSVRHLQLVGVGVFVAGMGLSMAAFTGSARHVEVATAPTIGLYMVWVLLVAYRAEPVA